MRMMTTLVLMLALASPLAALVLFVFLIKREFDRTLVELRKEPDWETTYDANLLKLMIFIAVLATPIMYAVLGMMLYYIGNDSIGPPAVVDDLATTTALLLGSGGAAAVVGGGLIAIEAARRVPYDPKLDRPSDPDSDEYRVWADEHRDELAKVSFPKYLVLVAVSHSPAIYGLLLTIMLYSATGVLDSANQTAAAVADEVTHLAPGAGEHMLLVGAVFALCVAPSVMTGYLATRKTDEITDIEEFKSGLIWGCIGHSPAIIGLIVAVVLMLEFGLLS